MTARPALARLSRRSLLAAALGAPLVLGSARLAFAQGRGDNRFVLVVLRGGLDGLAVVPPLGDPAYRRLRPSLALADPGETDGALDLDGFFGLHPSLEGLHKLYGEGELLVLHGVASPYRERSHFDAQNVLEGGGTTANATHDGWLNRALAGFGPTAPDLGLAIAQSPPFVIQGAVPVGSWAPGTLPDMPSDVMAMIQALYANDPMLGPALEEGLRTRAMAEQAGGTRGRGDFAELARTAGALLAAADGPRIAVMEETGWDTHAGQGAAQGQLARRLVGLDDGLMALRLGLGPQAWSRTVVVAVTEFGRTAAENGTRGTDHGTASASFVVGGAVNGGQVLTRWPGLAPDQLHEGRDLASVVDMRSIFKAVLSQHLGLDATWLEASVFPDSAGVGAIRNMARG